MTFCYNRGLPGNTAGDLPVKLKLGLCVLVLAPCAQAAAQHAVALATPLSVLLAEVDANNGDVTVAGDDWKASTHVMQQVSRRPGPQLTFESSSVGNPKPLAGISNSEFAYVGFGASQDIPYKNKLKLRGEAARRGVATQKANIDVVRSTVEEQAKLYYLQLAYSTGAIAYLDRTDSVLQSLIQDATARYSLGQGSQAAILKAQLERTDIRRQATMHSQTLGQTQARLKELLHRRQDSTDIYPEPLKETVFNRDIDDLQARLRDRNPSLLKDAAAISQQDAQLASARRDSKPDFNVGYRFDLTGDDYRNRYVASLNIQLPDRGRVAAEVAQAQVQATRARDQLDAEVQQTQAALQIDYVAATETTELLRVYTEGLLPQAEAVFHSEESAFQANKEDLAPVLNALVAVLSLENDYQQALFDHESALVRIETLTGEKLR